MKTRKIFGALAIGLVPVTSGAAAVDTSLRPLLRPTTEAASIEIAAAAPATVPDQGTRPMSRPETPQIAPVDAATQAGFERWIRDFRTRAARQGIRESVLDSAFRHARYDPEVIARDRNQSEFTKTIWDYLDSAASDKRIENGRTKLAEHRDILNRIEARYGVDKEVVLAIWGMESAYGAYRGSKPLIGSLATLAHDGRRGAFFEKQLIAALEILQNGDTTPARMTGSWAGAMGHTQFIPTSYLDLAVDFTSDGRRDIWSDDPTDALASTAAYLARFGWVKGMPWGVEVRLPDGFDYASANRQTTRMPSEWARLGVVDMNGGAVRDYGAASVLLPAGAEGAAFLIFKNFRVIERYNAADAYVIGVGHLSDRIKGGAPIQADWPRGDRALTRAERKELQRLLTARGFGTGGIDGRIGPNSIKALRNYQRTAGLAPDGYPSLAVLKKLR
ncbi:lytic murein transglycosylase [Thalassococcus sp. BH17M4-6]|uniref:lytic murein transglycosylase n=1 Tax=Thalassococcus sp. BH17M4-6 TaxID=3413148 RepID=UPI003BD8A10B